MWDCFRLVSWVAIGAIGLTATIQPNCSLKPNPYLKRSVADNLLLEVKAGRDDGKTAAQILPDLRKKVPSISCLAIRKNMFGQTIVELSLEQPWVLLLCEGQPPQILTRSGTITPAHLMREDVLANLAAITISRAALSSGHVTELTHWLLQQPDTFFSRFQVLWHDKNDIEVHDQQLPLVTIRATHETLFTNKTLTFLDKNREKEVTLTTIDLRYGDQIILVPKISRGKKI